MKFKSTRNNCISLTFLQAMRQGLAPDGGLYIPEHIPKVKPEILPKLAKMNFADLAFFLSCLWIDEGIEPQELQKICHDAFYFDLPLQNLDAKTDILELFHGPTHAFKDFAARYLARLMGQTNQKITVLTATSGDTGSAVAHAFYGVKNVQVIILFPKNGVSRIQRLQMTSLGGNITALAVNGSFDQCQALVKEAFLSPSLNLGLNLTSANSINIARLIPQSFYAAWVSLCSQQPLHISIPSGNWGNFCASLIARKMGFDLHLIASCNQNDTVLRFQNTGQILDTPVIRTLSNAMDVAAPSNLERLKAFMPETDFQSLPIYSFDDQKTLLAIEEVYQKYNYVMDPHTAIGYLGAREFQKTHPDSKVVIYATAHPAKFLDSMPESVKSAIEIPPALQFAESKDRAIELQPVFSDLQNFLNGLS